MRWPSIGLDLTHFSDFPLNAPTKPVVEEKQKDGFTQVMNHKKQAQKKPNQSSGRRSFNNNSFDALNNLPEDEEVENPHKSMDQHINKGKEKQNPNPYPKEKKNGSPTQEKTGTNAEDEEDTLMQMDEQELADIDLDKLEEALNKQDLKTIPVEKLRKVHKVFLDSTVGATSRLGVSPDPDPDPKRNPKEGRRQGRKSTQQLIKEAGNYLINSGQIHHLPKRTSSLNHPTLNDEDHHLEY
jgi:hypothetical protein